MNKPSNPKLLEIGGYLAALLPAASVYLSIHVSFLRGTPLALSFLLTCLLARTFSRGPSYLAPILSAVCFNLVAVTPRFSWSAHPAALVQTGVILILGFSIVYLFQREQQTKRNMRQANDSLQDRTNALVQAQQGSNSAAWSFDTRTRCTRWYEGGVELFGRSLEELTAMGSPLSLVLEEDRPAIAAAFAHTQATGELYRVEFRITLPNGEVRWLESLGTPQVEDPHLWRGVSIDITQRKAAEKLLLRSEKLAAASQLASSVSHEINNPLASVTNLVYLARSGAVDLEQQSYLDMAQAELARIAYIANQSLRFHRQQYAPVTIDCAEVLRQVLKIYQPRLAAHGITTRFEAEGASSLLCFDSEIRQVFGNLLQNAMEAMPEGGTLWVRVRPSIHAQTGDTGVRVTIANTGHGMSRETRKRLFEPFFTTKGGTNSGLGLWVAAGIVYRHRGTIRAWSSAQPGRTGSAFSVYLPLAD